jgi:3-keto-disaccharide hydrolase
MNRRTLMHGLAAAALPFPAFAGAAVPQPIDTHLVVATAGQWQGRDCLAIELSDEEQKLRLTTQGGGNRPSFAIVARDFTDGTIEVEIGAELTGKGAPDDRGFVGLSFHILPDYLSHETVYLRMTNGRLNVPPPPAPRIDRAVQYVADPGFHFSDSREKFPGRYEKGADIAVGRWFRYRLEIAGRRVRALVDGVEVLAVDDMRFAGRTGPVGLFVGDGSRGFFRELRISG